jgi:steroid 5-alpha reductase family enzyme
MSKARSLLVVAGAYVIAIAVAAAWLCWGPSTDALLLDTLIADVLATVVVFVFSRIYRNSSFYDAFWSVIPPLLLFYWWSQAGPGVDRLRCWLVAGVVVLWAIRLTYNWIRGFPGLHHEDWRFGEFSFWFAVALFGVAAAPADVWWLFVGAAIMLALFLFASIPMMEARRVARRPEYQEVIDRVSRFVPWPPKGAVS